MTTHAAAAVGTAAISRQLRELADALERCATGLDVMEVAHKLQAYSKQLLGTQIGSAAAAAAGDPC